MLAKKLFWFFHRNLCSRNANILRIFYFAKVLTFKVFARTTIKLASSVKSATNEVVISGIIPSKGDEGSKVNNIFETFWKDDKAIKFMRQRSFEASKKICWKWWNELPQFWHYPFCKHFKNIFEWWSKFRFLWFCDLVSPLIWMKIFSKHTIVENNCSRKTYYLLIIKY